ncbi:cilia- and flagella-associated protein 61 [Cystoisospora suis]|uniref:Cilia-and flagella-associated protein 61 n=1 Tax=Cystoisospora suis TaxID=483139 RepID=A0A2C6LB44_9APIC|nr:cilia- and flagella-associated protein 61 [Cystoisospora suis]
MESNEAQQRHFKEAGWLPGPESERRGSQEIRIYDRSFSRHKIRVPGARYACRGDCPDIRRLLDCILSDACEQEGGANEQAGLCKDLAGFFGFEREPPPSDLSFLEDLIDESYQSLIAEDVDGKVIGFAALGHSPRVCPEEQQNEQEGLSGYMYKWPEWLSATYSPGADSRQAPSAETPQKSADHSVSLRQKHKFGGAANPVIPQADGPAITASNTLWVNFLVYSSSAASSVLEAMIEAIFASAFELQHLLMFNRSEYSKVPALLPKLLDAFSPLGVPAESGAQTQHSAQPAVFFCSREGWVKPLKIRRAEVEDYDDLVKVFDSQTELRSQDYGEFFLAELIGGQDENNKCLAAEANGFAVGLAGFTADVDINLLNNCFDLEKYDFLVNPEYMEKIKTTMVNRLARTELLTDTSAAPSQGSSSGPKWNVYHLIRQEKNVTPQSSRLTHELQFNDSVTSSRL